MNIVYGLGRGFIEKILMCTDILSNSIAFCDKDPSVRQKYPDGILGIPVISPEEICDFYGEESVHIYITTPIYYEEIFIELTHKFNIPYKNISYLRIPHSEMFRDIADILYRSHGPATPIRDSAFEGALLLADRIKPLKLLPKNMICAEVGVAYGDFSKSILKICKPEKFYAIDLFSTDNPYYWNRDYLTKEAITHREWYEREFDEYIENGILETRQGFSWDVLSDFPDHYFDYIYVDAAHDYDSVMKDINVLKSKIKPGGYVQFNDYTPGDNAIMTHYGVISAVNQFINNGNHQVKFFCLNESGFHDIVVQTNAEERLI
jgi:hypothetical protein